MHKNMKAKRISCENSQAVSEAKAPARKLDVNKIADFIYITDSPVPSPCPTQSVNKFAVPVSQQKHRAIAGPTKCKSSSGGGNVVNPIAKPSKMKTWLAGTSRGQAKKTPPVSTLSKAPKDGTMCKSTRYDFSPICTCTWS